MGVLSRRVGKLGASPVRTVCEELCSLAGLTLEAVEQMQLYEFLNKHGQHLRKPKSKKNIDPRDIIDRWR